MPVEESTVALESAPCPPVLVDVAFELVPAPCPTELGVPEAAPPLAVLEAETDWRLWVDEAADADATEADVEDVFEELLLLFPTVPPTAPPTTAPITSRTSRPMSNRPRVVRQNGTPAPVVDFGPPSSSWLTELYSFEAPTGTVLEGNASDSPAPPAGGNDATPAGGADGARGVVDGEWTGGDAVRCWFRISIL